MVFARVNTFQGKPEGVDESTRQVREDILPRAREMEGFKGLLALADRSTGKTIGITFWETEEAMRATEDAATKLRSESAQASGEEIVSVERYEVTLDERK